MPLCTKVLCRRSTAAASPLQQRRPCSSVAPAAPPAHKAQLTTALMAQGWCHESVDIATAQGAVQQLRAASTPSQQRRRRCSVAVVSIASAQSAMDHRSALMAQAHWCEDSLPLYKVLCSTLGLPEYCHVCCINRGATELQLELELERLQLRDESTASQV